MSKVAIRSPSLSSCWKSSLGRRQRATTTAFLACLLLALGCTKYAIRSEGDLLASKIGNETTRNRVDSRFENPQIDGLISVRVRLETDSRGRPGTCCSSLRMKSDHPIFRNSDLLATQSAFISITDPSIESFRNTPVFEYQVPTVSLPGNGDEVGLTLFYRRDRLTTQVRLDPRVIVVPVHLHVFTSPGQTLASDLEASRVWPWFERPSFFTEGQTIHSISTGVTETHIVRTNLANQVYLNVDEIWHQADIQFRLASYERIENAELENQIVSGNVRAFEPSSVHASRSDTAGLHIYVGRNGGNIGVGFARIQGQTRGPGCGNAVRANNAIAMAWDTVGRGGGGPSRTLAHEIGHYLGLDHPDVDSTSCGSSLVEDRTAANLMHSFANSPNLSTGQIARARQVACLYLAQWSVPSSACA
ncbi:MAG: hypothetical protein K0U98_09365 [Deltaproteobacteria bacterium]|nr:hypothetical protein [Deltaproteobacteria bacterium]